jgi:hypothetical protein
MRYYQLKSICAWVGEDSVYPCDSNALPDIGKGIKFLDLKPDWFQLLNTEEKEYISKLIKNKSK